jgi:hypothetical protein
VVFFLGEIWQKFRPEKYDFNLYKGFSIHKANMPTTTILCKKTRGVSHCGLAIYIVKYLKTKEELWKTQIFISPCKHIIFKKSSKRK